MRISNSAIPVQWRETCLKNIARIKSGSTPLRTLNERYFVNGTLPWIKTMDLTNGKIIEVDEKITDLAIQETSCPIIEEGTVLVAMYGGFNQIGRTGITTFPCSINQAISSLSIDKEKAIPEFILHWLNAHVGLWRRFAASSRKDPNITKKDVEDFLILLPPLAEQRKIAEILSTWDEAIAKTERLIAALQARKKGLMQRLLTGQVRFPGFNGDWKETELGEFLIPSLRKIEKPKDGYLRLGIRSHGKGTFISVMDEDDSDAVEMTHLFEVKEGDLIVSITFAWEGAIAIVGKDGDGALVSHRFPTYTFDTMKIVSEYFRYVMLTKRFFYDLRLISPGGAGRNRVMNKTDFLKLKIKAPSLEEQKKIGGILVIIDENIDALAKKLDLLKQQKKGLMQRLLTGEIRVVGSQTSGS